MVGISREILILFTGSNVPTAGWIYYFGTN